MSDALFTRPTRIPQPSGCSSITTAHKMRTLAATAKSRRRQISASRLLTRAKEQYRGPFEYCEVDDGTRVTPQSSTKLCVSRLSSSHTKDLI